jgi:hypothetical protein
MTTIAEKIIAFNKSLEFTGNLPTGIKVLNPFRDNEHALTLSSAFYRKYYNDNNKRYLILGINPGRFGMGLTGIPFTDPKRLEANCHISAQGLRAHEPSSAFIYDMIKVYGGEELFYSRFYIHSVCPLGFTSTNSKGRDVNYNYYDSPALLKSVYDFIVWNIKSQINMGVFTDVCFFLGTGKNQHFLQKLNKEFSFFKKLVPLEHPRFIMQYKAREKEEYIAKYLKTLNSM